MKKCLVGVVRLTINAIKRKFLYYDYKKAFDGAGFKAINKSAFFS